MGSRRRITAVAVVLGLALAGAAFAAAVGERVTVQNMGVRLMAEKRRLAKTVAQLPRGAHLVVEAREGDWLKARPLRGGPSGWVPASAVVRGEVKLTAVPGWQSSGVRAQEVELAARGFNPQVEAEYLKKHSNLQGAYRQLDHIVQVSPDPGRVLRFAAEGGLATQGGGR